MAPKAQLPSWGPTVKSRRRPPQLNARGGLLINAVLAAVSVRPKLSASRSCSVARAHNGVTVLAHTAQRGADVRCVHAARGRRAQEPDEEEEDEDGDALPLFLACLRSFLRSFLSCLRFAFFFSLRSFLAALRL